MSRDALGPLIVGFAIGYAVTYLLLTLRKVYWERQVVKEEQRRLTAQRIVWRSSTCEEGHHLDCPVGFCACRCHRHR